MEIAFARIRDEFMETFGYVRQDIAAIRDKELGLNYTVALLVCCACEMLAWHRDLTPHQVFTSLLPTEERYRVLGKTLWEALRNGLAHHFRPDTIMVGEYQWRVQFAWERGRCISVIRGRPNWFRLNVKLLSERVTAEINAYEVELRNNASTRLRFLDKCKISVKPLQPDALSIAAALNSVLSEDGASVSEMFGIFAKWDSPGVEGD